MSEPSAPPADASNQTGQVRIGQVLANRYELLERIGAGGMSTVYRALDRNTKKMVAVKILREELCKDAAFIARFEAECTAVSRMTHPNVAGLLDVGVEGELHYLVIEFVFGTSLKDMIKQSGALRGDTAGQIAIRILSALQHAHQNGIIHRDVKPQNILIDKQGVVKVLDFGIARLMDPAGKPQPGGSNDKTKPVDPKNGKDQLEEMPLGSVHYFSPEQARGKAADHKSDIYSVGVVLYEMLTGALPFQGQSQMEVALQHIEDAPRPPTEINPNANAELSKIVLRAMEKDPANRHESAAAMIQAIRHALKKPEVSESKQAPSEPVLKPSEEPRKDKQDYRLRWSRRVLTTSFTVLLLLVIGLLVTNVARSVIHSLSNHIIMPVVTNYSWEVASQNLMDLGLEVLRRDQIVEIGNENLVIEQEPMPGVLLSKGDSVTLVVSKSEYDIIMPDLTHETVGKAMEIIEKFKLNLGAQETIVSQVAVGQVVGQSPAAGVKVRYGTSVMLTVSGGLMVVPDLLLKTEQEARDWLKADGQLALQEVQYQTVNDSAMDGVVIAQSPEVAKQVMLQTPVTLTIGRLEQRIYLGQAEALVRLDHDALIRGMLLKPDGTEELQYCAIHPAGDSAARFLVRSALPGVQTVRVYNESELIQSITVTLE
ncbi:MAG: Stk1 family PASTA domain-containing Ser/Thr kinase [Oscillospiraceae bacterium]|jgi:serine/threonine-protein kinase|nr:Stk1 family PASTA domain-containing Ser/Thr kinase [Oscillospiraceae bacterium]